MSRMLNTAEADEVRQAADRASRAVEKFRKQRNPRLEDVTALCLELTLSSYDARLVLLSFEERIEARKKRAALETEKLPTPKREHRPVPPDPPPRELVHASDQPPEDFWFNRM